MLCLKCMKKTDFLVISMSVVTRFLFTFLKIWNLSSWSSNCMAGLSDVLIISMLNFSFKWDEKYAWNMCTSNILHEIAMYKRHVS